MRAVAVIATSLGVLAGAVVPAAAASEAAPAACAPSDLVLRQATNPASPVPDVDAVYALKNRGATSCTVSGSIGIRLFDAQGKLIDVRAAVRNAMGVPVTLAPGDEATFSIAFAPHAPMDSVTAAHIEVFLASQLVPVSAPTTVAAYVGAVRVSSLRLTPPAFSKFMP